MSQTAAEFYAQRLDHACSLPEMGSTRPEMGRPAIHRKEEAISLALEFLSDLASPDGYGHSVSPEVVKRAARILALLRPKEPPRSGIGYEPPPPPRCEKCDSE